MFAVPGWSVSADSLKAETAAAKPTPSQSEPSEPDSSNKKRKRPSKNVTASNVADLWEQVIEGKPAKKKAKPDEPAVVVDETRPVSKRGVAADGTPRLTLKDKKRLKKQRDKEASGDVDEQDTSEAPAGEGKKDKKPKKKAKDHQIDEPVKKEEKSRSAATTKLTAPPAPKLTPMQAAMREKLVSARFRHLNETLYTKPSGEAFELFADTPEMFTEYHEGFRRQVDVWPENPVDGYIADIRTRGRVKAPHHGGKSSKSGGLSAPGNTVQPLPRTSGTCTIADLGCGDGKLGTTLHAGGEAKKLNVKVLSYDLQSPGPHVTRADIAALPLADGSVNVAVFCLALMGTNWLDFVDEAYRVLHWKGELWVAEIKSRFAPSKGKGKGGKGHGQSAKGANAPVEHSVGNRRKNPKKGGKEGEGDDENEAQLAAVEIDGAEDRRQETDVSAFVEALRKRGFVLQGHGERQTEAAAIDLSNKMFVKMHFVKGATPTVGKGAVALKESGRGEAAGGRGGGGAMNKNRKGAVKFIDAEEQQGAGADEGSILKPCVYKLR
ncbi:Uu.00g019030.m01.CDS01 [Anthostomella pinea]|uniref:Ribosomal RNA-processing protein 8 n=1 Tax=Anthostomella pinea TaxID=933095 RepID=A0AAI8VZV0_9PEZI|nr:Uu.00g019030.m01.CDS01 [Anthostomella pinea]